MEILICPICNREYGGDMEDHHLKPKTFRTRTNEVHERDNLVRIHRICHQKIHATFSENDLYSYYYTVDRIIENEEMKKFIKWVNKKDPDYYNKNNDTKDRKRKRKR